MINNISLTFIIFIIIIYIIIIYKYNNNIEFFCPNFCHDNEIFLSTKLCLPCFKKRG